MFKRCEICGKNKLFVSHRVIKAGVIHASMPLVISKAKMCRKCFKTIKDYSFQKVERKPFKGTDSHYPGNVK